MAPRRRHDRRLSSPHGARRRPRQGKATSYHRHVVVLDRVTIYLVMVPIVVLGRVRIPILTDTSSSSVG